MSSSVFFRFKSQKEPTRVAFDGTGISVFDLKREIITISRLGDGTTFELILTSSDGHDEVYDDDTEIIPRSTTVIAKRLPAVKPGKGGAARYVSGKAPVNARVNKTNSKFAPVTQSLSTSVAFENQTEEERMTAVLKQGADQWKQKQQELSHVVPVPRPGQKGRPHNVPDSAPPDSYCCHRCGQKGHWIQLCPRNDDPTLDDRRFKRTTGIPKSFLSKVEKSSIADDAKPPAGVMLDANGDWVRAEPDKAAWEKFQAKANKSAAEQEKANRGSKELQERGLECPVDKRMFVEPTKTPCCKKTYCNECITNALLDDDLRCPGCSKDGILIDDLEVDTEAVKKIRVYKAEKAAEAAQSESQQEAEKAIGAPSPNQGKTSDGVQTGSNPTASEKAGSKSPKIQDSKKRKADDELENDRKSKSPALGEKTNLPSKSDDTQDQSTKEPPTGPKVAPELAFMDQQLAMTTGAFLPGMNAFMPVPNMNFASMMNMNTAMNGGMWNPIMMANGGGTGNQWNPYQQQGMMYGNNGQGMGQNGFYGQNMNGMNMNTMANGGGQGSGGYPNNNQRNFNANRPNAEESAYFRQPVNPHRHQGRRNIPRPTDYREI